MPVTAIIALLCGAIVLVSTVLLTANNDLSTVDESMEWEGRVAIGFTVLVGIVPFVIAQLIFTIIAGRAWLWLAWVGAPLAGYVVGRVLRR